MKKLAKIFLLALLGLSLLLAAALSLTVGWRPFIGPRARKLTDRRFEATPARRERGARIAHVSGCIFCHSPHDYKTFGEPVPVGRELSGAQLEFSGLPGKVTAPNLTPDGETGAGSWSDDQLARSIREGIGHDGRALFPMMPYQNLRHMSDEDLASVIVYLRSVPPIRNQLPPTKLAFPVNYLIRNAPEPLNEPVPEPNPSEKSAVAKYLAARSGCADCHTPKVRGQEIEGMTMAGGFTLSNPSGTATAANLTPDVTGISYYDEALFVQAMRTGLVKARQLSPHMPYSEYKYLTDDELSTMFGYLQTLPAVKHRVDNSLPPTLCKLCQGKHGAGDQN